MKSKSAMKHNKKNVTHSDNGVTSEDKHHYTIEVSKKTLIFTLVISALVSFIAGRSAQPSDFISFHADSNQDVVPSKGPQEYPSLMLHAHKEPPQHRYSGMEFNASASNGRVVNTHLPSSLSDGEKVCTIAADGDKQCVIDNTNSDVITDGKIQVKENEDIDETDGECSSGEECEDDDKDEHLPAGQHLLIDIKNVDSEFLNSDVRLAKAMVDVVNLSQLTLLSYHCHNLIPQGVSCVGVLLESHISFHTWPEAGVITLDLFTCGSGKLVPVIPFVESLFAVQQIGSLVKPFVRWVHKLRGFRPEGNDDVLSKDLGRMLEETFDLKKEVASVQTTFQRIDVFELDEGKPTTPEVKSYMEKYPEYFKPQRIVYLDGVIQSTLHNIEPYHEALVHPAMFAHNDPKKVAIIGGGEGATLMEVLKHDIESVHMIEIDEEMVQTSRTYLPEWSDCSDIIGSEKWCGDDKRAHLFYEDALAWFIDRFSEDGKYAHENHPKFDVLIMDALDPQDDIPFAELLYTDDTFISSLYNSLNEDGVIVFQLGEAPHLGDAPDEMNLNRRRATLMSKLAEIGFEGFHIYEDGNCGFEYPWTFLVVTKDDEMGVNWYKNEAEVQIAIHERTLRTHSGKPVLKYFDGATMRRYQVPHKVFEATFCRQTPTPLGCEVESVVGDVPESDVEVKTSTFGDNSGRGLFTKVDIKKGMTFGREVSARPVYFPPYAVDYILHFNGDDEDDNAIEEIKKVFSYMDGYGWQTNIMGMESYYVDASVATFVNHGCNGTFNIGSRSSLKSNKVLITEQNAKESDHDELLEGDFESGYNPLRLRKLHHGETHGDLFLEDVNAGEEILCNYIDFQEGDVWWEEVQVLKRMCNGEEVGFITKTELTNIENSE